jgi:hypothetical protein
VRAGAATRNRVNSRPKWSRSARVPSAITVARDEVDSSHSVTSTVGPVASASGTTISSSPSKASWKVRWLAASSS